MDIVQLKEYILDNNLVETILEEIGCHHIAYHSSSSYWSAANYDGDNKHAINIKKNEYLSCINHTRQMINNNRSTDIIDLICYNKDLSFPEALKYMCNILGLDYYHNFDDDIPESLLITKMLYEMQEGSFKEQDKPLKPISKQILNYYKPYVNDMFYKDNIDYQTQREFDIGYDEFTNRITIPIYSDIGDLVGVKGRLFKEHLSEDELKYLYLEPCSKSKILYGIHKTISYIKQSCKVYVLEAEKGVMQLWSYGYRNCVSTGGKELSTYQIEMLTRLGVDIVLCFDADVQKTEIEELAERFIDNVPIYYIFDEYSILKEKESPSDNPNKWTQLLKNNVYRIR